MIIFNSRMTLTAFVCIVLALGVGLQSPVATAAAKETHVYINEECLVTKDAKPAGFGAVLLAVIAPTIAENSVSGLATLFKKMGEDQKKSYSGYKEIPLYLRVGEPDHLRLNPELGCITVVTGKFHTDIPAIPKDKDSKSVTSEAVGLLHDAGINVLPADLVYEAQILASPDQTAFRIRSTYLEINEFQSGKKKVGLVVGITLNGPSKDGKPATLTGSPINLGVVKKSRIVKLGQFEAGKETVLLKTPFVSPEAAFSYYSSRKERIRLESQRQYLDEILPIIIGIGKEANNNGDDQRKLAAKKALAEIVTKRQKIQNHLDLPEIRNRNFMPIDVQVTVTETTSGSKAAKYIANVLEGSKEAIKTVVANELSPTVQDKVKRDEEDRVRGLNKSLSEAQVKYADAYLASAKSPDATGVDKEVLDIKLVATRMVCDDLRAALGRTGECTEE